MRYRVARASLVVLAIVILFSVGANGQSPPPYGFGNGMQGAPAPLPRSANGPSNTPANFSSIEPSARIAANNSMGTGTLGDPVSLGGDPAPAAPTKGAIDIGNIVSIIRSGGVLMLPILGCSVLLLVFVLERLFFLRRSRIIPRPFVRGVIEQLEQGQLDRDEATNLCEENGSPIAELFSAAFRKWGRPAVEVEQSIVDTGMHVTSQLRRYLRLFSAISNLTPLLGLLGTVTGMIQAFNTIAAADGMGRAELLAGGIGAALLTTAAGLSVAIPAYAAYAYFAGRCEKLLLEMDSLSQSVVDLVSAEALQNSSSRSRSRSRKAA